MVANAVTIQGEATLLRSRATFGGSLGRVAVSRAEPIGDQLGWRPLMPVTQWTAIKP
jgi:precorrin-6Y C5,15-methyltransferase (decarboxylating)